ncbi:ubiquitin-conjugating enzyme E2 E1-like [Juglans microcarpa x Juglans regia]|uniref:ubiquitin-conjugating enzyme E2 E1-like n=1 Tax=Juglans microcarpa x Juglans regia TaxID=2249226 RepID=UPI001B7F5BE4|nr:ubiquitin-conjugating enzyme E2 E1-like [Juglans microcarpa x Juglans regia]
MGTLNGLFTAGNFLLNQRKDENSNNIPKLYKKLTEEIMFTKLMKETARAISVERKIPTQGVLNHVDLAPKIRGKNAKSAIPISCYVATNFNFPFKPPKVVFKTRIFHCNVDTAGVLSLDILKDSWSPALTITNVLLAIRAIFTNPDPSDNSIIPGIARLYLADRAKHDELAAEWTRRFAK